MKQERKDYISALNVCACFCVIVLHCNGVFWSFPHGRLWITTNLIETLCYWPVPVFFMITGATLVDYRKRYTTKEYLKKRFNKVAIPFLFWSMVAYLYCTITVEKTIDYNIFHIIDNIINTRYISIYWFFIPLMSIYLTIPILAHVDSKLSVFKYASIIGIIFVAGLPLVCNILKITYNEQLRPGFVNGYVLFVFLGYVLSNEEISPLKRNIIYFSSLVGWGMHFFGTIVLSRNQSEINLLFKGYYNIPSVIYAMGIFLFFKNVDFEKLFRRFPILKKIIDTLSLSTFGIYLIHFYFIEQLPLIFHINKMSFEWRIGGPIIIFCVCGGITGLFRRIPMLRRVV